MNSYLERLRQELEKATAGTGDLGQVPEGKWSPAQILEHLLLTYKNTDRALEKCLEQGAPLATRARLKDRFAALLVVNLGYIPSGRKAPERALPRGMAPEEVRREILPALGKMATHLDDCERLFGGRTKILDHPFLGPLTADQWRKFHWIHGRHHVRQVRERLGRA
jgi:hypothetical protein